MKTTINKTIEKKLDDYIFYLQNLQHTDGSWRFCFEESGMMGDAYTIVLLRALNDHDEQFIQLLAHRIKSRQLENGSWKLFDDEKAGNLSATILSYYALLISGKATKDEPLMKRAFHFIAEHGGLHQATLLTKVFLSITGQYPWKNYFLIPIEFLLLPEDSLINFFDFVGYARVHIAPTLILAEKQFTLALPHTPDLSQLLLENQLSEPDFSYTEWMNRGFHKSLPLSPHQLKKKALRVAEQFMLERIEPDGTLYSYASSTILMIFALLALDYPKNHPIIKKAVQGLKGLACYFEREAHIQNSPSTIWDTALLSYALQKAGVSTTAPSIQKASAYLLSKQQVKAGDWYLKNPVTPGGWGFSESNTINPDVDDTAAVLRAIYEQQDSSGIEAWNRGLQWILSMQNRDGGWAAFEKNTDHPLLAILPLQNAKVAAIDPSTPDITGRVLEMLGKYAGYTLQDENIRKATNWLLQAQKKDGSWYGRWGIRYIYGTWAAVQGLLAVGLPTSHPAIQKAKRWLLSTQLPDGGWGESCLSDQQKHYISLPASTISQTSWAIDTLIAILDTPIDELTRGVQFILHYPHNSPAWVRHYPTGAGLPEQFYIHYHSYSYIWPLLTLAHYHEKFIGTNKSP